MPVLVIRQRQYWRRAATVVLTGDDSSGISFIPSFLRASLTHTRARRKRTRPCGLDQCSLLQHPFEGGVECFLGMPFFAASSTACRRQNIIGRALNKSLFRRGLDRDGLGGRQEAQHVARMAVKRLYERGVTALKSSSVTRRSSLGTIPSLIFSMGISGAGRDRGIENGKLRIENFCWGGRNFSKALNRATILRIRQVLMAIRATALRMEPP